MRALYILRTKCSGAEREVLQLAVLYRTRPFLSAGKERKIEKERKERPVVSFVLDPSWTFPFPFQVGWNTGEDEVGKCWDRTWSSAFLWKLKEWTRKERGGGRDRKRTGREKVDTTDQGVERTIKVWVPCTFNRREIWRYCLIRRRRKGRVKGEESSG